LLPATRTRISRTVKVAATRCQNRPSATLRTFVHVSHDDFYNVLLSCR
jgi:hypothetical protein